MQHLYLTIVYTEIAKLQLSLFHACEQSLLNYFPVAVQSKQVHRLLENLGWSCAIAYNTSVYHEAGELQKIGESLIKGYDKFQDSQKPPPHIAQHLTCLQKEYDNVKKRLHDLLEFCFFIYTV